LTHDGSGYWLATKRLICGKFDGWPRSRSDTLSTIEARELLEILQKHDFKKPLTQAPYNLISDEDHEEK
jgi:hypothetical protein